MKKLSILIYLFLIILFIQSLSVFSNSLFHLAKAVKSNIEKQLLEVKFRDNLIFFTNNKQLLGEKPNTIILEDENKEIQTMYYCNYNNHLLIIYTVLTSMGGYGRVVKYEGSSLEKKWSYRFVGFSLGKPLISNEYLYIYVWGRIYKFNLENENCVWEKNITDLLRKYKIETPSSIIKEKNYLFLKEGVHRKKRKPITIQVDDKSGNIIRIISK